MTPLDAVLGALVMAVGACIQGAVGFGSNLFAAPLLLLLSDRFVPVPIVLASMVLNVLVTRREGRAAIDPLVGSAIAGQVPGAVLAGVALATLPERGLSILFAALVLVGVVLTGAGWHLRPTRPTLAGVGAASAFMGTISGIGGPPIALAFQRADGPTLRATLSRFFLVGSAVSVVTFAVVGRLGWTAVAPTLALLPGTVTGFGVSRPVAAHLDRRSARPVVHALSTLSALAVLARELR